MTATGSTGVTHDARGNITATASAGYGYNAANRLWYESAGGRGFYYDQLGRLSNITGGPSYQIMIHAGGHAIAEGSGWGGILRRHVFGPGTDEPLVWYEGTGTTDRRWLHADERGSIIAVSDGITRFLYDGDALVAEGNGANVIQRQYVHGPGSSTTARRRRRFSSSTAPT